MTTHKVVLIFAFICFAILSWMTVFQKEKLAKLLYFTKNTFFRDVYIYFGLFTFGLLVFRRVLLKLPFGVQITLLFVMLFLIYKVIQKSEKLRQMVLPDFNPYQLSWFRIAICGTLLFMVLFNDIRQSVYLPNELLHLAPPLANFVVKLGIDLRSELFLSVVQWGATISLIAAILGISTRFSMILAALFFTLHYYVQICYTHFFHSGFVPLQMLYVLCLTGQAQLLSLDSMFRRRSAVLSTEKVQFAILGCLVIYGFSYFATGMSKLFVDPFWANNHNLKRMLLSDSIGLLDPILGLNLVPWYVSVNGPDILFGFIAYFALILELLAFLMVFHKPARKWLPVAFVGMHIGIFLAQKFLFFDLLFLPIMFLPMGVPLYKFMQKIKTFSFETLPTISLKKPIFITSLFISLIFGGWSFGWEKFPVSSVWGMYAVSGYAELIWYKKIYAVTNSGVRIDTDLTDEIPLLNTAKWQDVTPFPEHVYKEHKEMLSTIAKLLRTYAKLYNSKRKPEEQISHFDFQLIFWNFVKNPAGPVDEKEGYESVIIPVDSTKEPYYERLHNHQ
jgi:hypothetical protein